MYDFQTKIIEGLRNGRNQHKKQRKSDRRILKTKRNLRQSLIELMKTKPFEKITIREICDYADVNRNTFYYHYDCTQALLDEILSTLLDEIKDAVDGITNISEESGNYAQSIKKWGS